jgi:uncharacterized cupredoxin-like copper-binding protein
MTRRQALCVLSMAFLMVACGEPASTGPTTAVTSTITDEGMSLDQTTVPAGRVAFGVRNEGQEVHEFEVFAGRLEDVSVSNNVADTSSLELIDEVEDLVPGMTLTLEVDLEAGDYVLMSNYAGEFERGLVVELTVTE